MPRIHLTTWRYPTELLLQCKAFYYEAIHTTSEFQNIRRKPELPTMIFSPSHVADQLHFFDLYNFLDSTKDVPDMITRSDNAVAYSLVNSIHYPRRDSVPYLSGYSTNLEEASFEASAVTPFTYRRCPTGSLVNV